MDHRLGLVAIVVAATFLAGCGDDGDHGDSQTTAAIGNSADTSPSSASNPASSSAPSPAPGSEAPPATGYTATLKNVTGELPDGTHWSLLLPQVTGGDAAVRDAFHAQMTQLLTIVTGAPDGNGLTLSDGALLPEEKSRTVVGDKYISGVLIALAYSPGAAHPSTVVETSVLDIATRQPIKHLWTDPAKAKQELSTLVIADQPGGPRRLDANDVKYSEFSSWVALPEGLHVYVEVAHALGDYVPVTIPWDQVSALLKPEVRAVLVG